MRAWFSILVGAMSVGLLGAALAIVIASHGFKFAPILFALAGVVGLAVAVFLYREDMSDGA